MTEQVTCDRLYIEQDVIGDYDISVRVFKFHTPDWEQIPEVDVIECHVQQRYLSEEGSQFLRRSLEKIEKVYLGGVDDARLIREAIGYFDGRKAHYERIVEEAKAPKTLALPARAATPEDSAAGAF